MVRCTGAKSFPEVTAVFGTTLPLVSERLLSYSKLARSVCVRSQELCLCGNILILELNGIKQTSSTCFSLDSFSEIHVTFQITTIPRYWIQHVVFPQSRVHRLLRTVTQSQTQHDLITSFAPSHPPQPTTLHPLAHPPPLPVSLALLPLVRWKVEGDGVGDSVSYLSLRGMVSSSWQAAFLKHFPLCCLTLMICRSTYRWIESRMEIMMEYLTENIREKGEKKKRKSACSWWWGRLQRRKMEQNSQDKGRGRGR